jgi:hypothetical protein
MNVFEWNHHVLFKKDFRLWPGMSLLEVSQCADYRGGLSQNFLKNSLWL